MKKPELINLAKKAKNGHRKSIEELCRRKAKDILFSAYGILGNREDAEDAAQNAIIQIFEHIGDIRNPEYVEAWILQITRNACYKFIEKNKNIKDTFDIEDESIQPFEEDTDFIPEKYAENNDLRKQLLEIIMNLPVKRRETIFMYYYDGLSIKEIAQIMEIKENSVTGSISMARQSIKKELEERARQGTPIETSAVAVTTLGRALEISAADIFPAKDIAVFSQNCLAAARHANPLLYSASQSSGLLTTVSKVAIVAVAAGEVLFAANLSATYDDVPVSIVSGADIHGEILFADGDCNCNHKNPGYATLRETDVKITSAAWDIVNLGTQESVSAGDGPTVTDALTALKAAGEKGRYILVFRIIDADDNHYRVEREFEIPAVTPPVSSAVIPAQMGIRKP